VSHAASFLGEIAEVSVQAMPLLAEKHGAAPQFLPRRKEFGNDFLARPCFGNKRQ